MKNIKCSIKQHLIIFTCLVLALGLFGCGSSSSSRISGDEVYAQLDAYIEKGMSDGSFKVMSDYWYDHADEGRTFDYSSLDDRNGIIYFGTRTAKPFSFLKDNLWTGYTIEVIYNFCKEYGYGIKIDDYSDVNSAVLATSEGKCDIGGANISITEERGKSVDFSSVYYHNNIGVVINNSNRDKYKTLDDLDSALMGTVVGSAVPSIAEKIIKNYTHEEYNTISDACLALSQEKVECVSADAVILNYAIKEYPNLEFTCNLSEEDVFGFIYPKDRTEGNFFSNIATSFKQSFIDDGRWQLLLKGILNTFFITLASLIGGFVIGMGAYLLCRKRGKIVNAIVGICKKFIDGLPAVVFLMIIYYIVFGSISITNVHVSAIAFTLIFASSVFTMVQNAVEGVDKTQYEVSYALGYSKNQTFYRMILPQAARLFWLPCKAAVKTQIKATAVVGYIATIDITKVGDMIRSSTFQAFFPLLVTAALYFLLGWIFTKLVDLIRIKTEPSEEKSKRYLKGVKTDD